MAWRTKLSCPPGRPLFFSIPLRSPRKLVGFAIGSGDRSRASSHPLVVGEFFARIIIGADRGAPLDPFFFVSEAVGEHGNPRGDRQRRLLPRSISRLPAGWRPDRADAGIPGKGCIPQPGDPASRTRRLFSVARPALTETQAVAVLIGLVTGLYILTRADHSVDHLVLKARNMR